MLSHTYITVSLLFFSILLSGQVQDNIQKFQQLGEILPTPSTTHTASGAPGHDYWQQKVDYNISLTLDDNQQKIYGEETIIYHNQSPNSISYLWLQLDQNVRAQNSNTALIRESKISSKMNQSQIGKIETSFDGGFKIEYVKDKNNGNLKYIINKTMMRIDLPTTLKPGQKYSFQIKWWYNINNNANDRGRSGYEHFSEDDNNVYVIAQWFPRLCVYNDIEGWQNKQFLGRGEFALEFGDYDVKITVPADHLVASTGLLQNPNQVLTKEQKKRLKIAEKGGLHPTKIATFEEAESRIQEKSTKTKTWHFKAKNVRDFAFASSRRFIWDALGVQMSDGRVVIAQSMWTKEGDCLWSKYSTKAIAHTLKWYSYYTFDYPYPVAWSIDGSMGMEYPMICFNFGRCEDDGSYTQRIKYGHIGVIIHEVGHNWFPMIINSDERQWTWMDEGLNSFVQYLAEQQWERDYPSRRGPAHKIVDYMGGDKSKIVPIMVNSESILQFGNNAYGKPATALNILRETIMGRELFDFAFKEYANRWKFKSPTPADLFRTLEDASGVDLDWFFKGWFYTTEHVDIALSNVKYYQIDSNNPKENSTDDIRNRTESPRSISSIRNKKAIDKTQDEIDPSIRDFYTEYDPLNYDTLDVIQYEAYQNSLTQEERKLLEDKENYYELTFENKGGLIMPIIFEFAYEDGTLEYVKIPAEIWRQGQSKVTKAFARTKKVLAITLDPYLETADVDRSNNYYPPKQSLSKFELYKQRNYPKTENPMQRSKRAKQEKVIKP